MAHKELILDHIDGMKADETLQARMPNAISGLRTLSVGLSMLASNVRRIEEDIQRRLGPGQHMIVTFGNEIQGISLLPVECMFHWYSVSAYNYAVTVGRIGKSLLGRAEEHTAYAARVLPAVKNHRDKIGAHFEWAMGKGKLAEREISVCPMLGWENGRLVTHQMMLSMSHDGAESTSERLMPWSLTVVHDELTRRFWASAEGPAGSEASVKS